MRMILFFDLPTLTLQNRRDYARFRKFLQKNGFVMMQESVYSKMLLNQTNMNTLVGKIHKNKPDSGLIQILTVTEKQYAKIEYVLGDVGGDIIVSDDRMIIL